MCVTSRIINLITGFTGLIIYAAIKRLGAASTDWNETKQMGLLSPAGLSVKCRSAVGAAMMPHGRFLLCVCVCGE